MAEKPHISAEEQEFRDKNQWHSFKGALFGAVGGAAFFGLLGMLASSLVAFAAGPSAGPMGQMAAAMFTQPLPLLVIGGLMTLGTGCVYMAQKEATELRVLQDEHQAQQQAKCMGVAQTMGVAPEKAEAICKTEPVYEQNQRADGKLWEVAHKQATPAISCGK